MRKLALVVLWCALAVPARGVSVCYYNPGHMRQDLINVALNYTADRFQRVGIDIHFVFGDTGACQDSDRRFQLFFVKPTPHFASPMAVGIAFAGRAYVIEQGHYTPTTLALVTLHELGHLFGLEHSKRSGIMCPGYDFVDQIYKNNMVPMFDEVEGKTMRRNLSKPE